MLRWIVGQLFCDREQTLNDGVLVQEFRQTRQLGRSSRSDLGLRITHQVYVGWHQVFFNHIFSHSRSQLDEIVGCHVTYTPALVLESTADRAQKQLLCLCWTKNFSHSHEILHGQETHRVLIIGREASVQGQHFVDNHFGAHALHKSAHIASSSTAHHGSLVRAKRNKHAVHVCPH